MCNVIIFAGTTEGRELAQYLERQKVKIHVCAATEYGESLIAKSDYVDVSGKRLDLEEMKQLMKEKMPRLVVDATHPYATVVSAHIKEACEASGLSYIRLLREETSGLEQVNDIVYVNSVKEACTYFTNTRGNIFVTTGSKELGEYLEIPDYKDRVFARVLSSKEAMNHVMNLGFEGKNLICMQGPFSEELNYLMMKEVNAKYLVTKEAGKNGGFLEKINAAKSLHMTCVVIGRPKEEQGYSYYQVIELLNKEFSLELEPRQIDVVGIGVGTLLGMTLEARRAIEEADVIFGAKRMLDAVAELKKTAVSLYKKEDISAYLNEHSEYRKVAVLVSGDVGFYSAANQFHAYFKEDKVHYICGISSLVYFCSKIGKSWEQVTLLSSHGRKSNTIDAVRTNQKVFSLMGGKASVYALMEDLIAYGFEQLEVWVGEKLGYETQKIRKGNPKELLEYEFDTLCVVYMENPNAIGSVERIPDEDFIRGEVPMTKEEVRTLSLSKLEIEKDSVVYDIGAGTGSVSIHAAMKAYEGFVYAIEKKHEGTSLVEENKKKFKVSNIQVIEGTAPQALEELPVPTHAFIGGSSGKLGEIIHLLRSKNPNIKIVVNAITLETVAEAIKEIKELPDTKYEIVQIQSSRSKKAGPYHMMLGQNPVFIITIG